MAVARRNQVWSVSNRSTRINTYPSYQRGKGEIDRDQRRSTLGRRLGEHVLSSKDIFKEDRQVRVNKKSECYDEATKSGQRREIHIFTREITPE